MPTKAQAEGGSFEHTEFDGSTAPKPSSLSSDIVSQLLVQLNPKEAERSFDMSDLLEYQRAANYMAAAMIFLRDNAFLEQDIKHEHIKKRLLGHWGTCPGLNFVYAHTQLLINAASQDTEFIFVTGPGHGAPALLATLYLEGAISHFDPKHGLNREGFAKFIRAFSFPGGYPSHVNAETPGSIHEGGELGYALAVAFGSVLDAPNRISVAVIGDGESETGPTAAAWHAHKYLDPKESGAILPVLHVNGFKISERTIPGTMDDLELACLYTGYGYQVRVVEYGANLPENASELDLEKSVNLDMAASFAWAHKEIRRIQEAARGGNPITKPRWPLIILRTPKGWTGPARLDGNIQMVGSWRAHQVPLPKAADDDSQLQALQDWLSKYDPKDLFNTSNNNVDLPGASSMPVNVINDKALKIIPSKPEKRLGWVKSVYEGHQPLDLPPWKELSHPQGKEVSAMKAIGDYLLAAVERNPTTFRIFSPDELASNKLDAVFQKTHRCFQWDPETANNGGRVIEMLSEHTLQGLMQGYTLTGRTALFPSYESFLGIITTMAEQYAKFIKTGQETNWRGPTSSLNYIETSTLWRQEHNGYSHQNPGFITSLLALPAFQARVYFPADANTAVSTIAHMLRSKSYVNLLVGSKNPTSNWLTPEEADAHCIAGASVWNKFSTDNGVDPDVVIVGCGVETTFEAIAASALLRKEGVRVRMVNVHDLMILARDGSHPHALTDEAFANLFTPDKPVVFNYHGYPMNVYGLLGSNGVNRERFSVLGYIEEGTTTSPWSMLRMNKASRFDIASIAIGLVGANNPHGPVAPKAHVLQGTWKHALVEHRKYTEKEGEDPEWCSEIPQ